MRMTEGRAFLQGGFSMYSFQTGANKRKSKQTIRLMSIALFILIIALLGVTVSYLHASHINQATSEALLARAISEAADAQSAVYRLTQSSGSHTMTLLANVRGHIYALQSFNILASNIYGAGTNLADPDLLAACVATLDACEQRMQSGNVLTDLFTTLRDDVDTVVASFSAMQ